MKKLQRSGKSGDILQTEYKLLTQVFKKRETESEMKMLFLKVIFYIEEANHTYLFTESPGDSLSTLVNNLSSGTFNKHTFVLIALNLYRILEKLHNLGFSYSVFNFNSIHIGKTDTISNVYIVDLFIGLQYRALAKEIVGSKDAKSSTVILIDDSNNIKSIDLTELASFLINSIRLASPKKSRTVKQERISVSSLRLDERVSGSLVKRTSACSL